MLIDLPGAMTAFAKLSDGQLFLTFLDTIQVFGMKIKVGTDNAVLHMNGGQPKLVRDALILNRDVLLFNEASFRFPEARQGKGGNPETRAYGSAILSAQGSFVRASHTDGPFDVDLSSGAAQLSRNHPGSIWFDAWEVVVTRAEESEVLFAHG